MYKYIKPVNNRLLATISTLGLVVGLWGGAAFSAMPVKCDPSNSTTIERVNACIDQSHLTSILQKFQKISDSNPDYTFVNFMKPGDKFPPGSRDAGTPGDRASVDYISKYMKGLGYTVTVQSYPVIYTADKTIPILSEVSPNATNFVPGNDFSTATFSPSGDVTAHIQSIDPNPPVEGTSALGCNASDFASFTPGNIALLQRGTCGNRTKVLNAIAAGAVGVITMNTTDVNSGNTLISVDGMTVPVFAYIRLGAGQKLYSDTGGTAGLAVVHMKADLLAETRTTYSVIADSPFGDPNNVVVLGGHYDSLFGAGILDNASGVASMMEIANAMKNTKTVNKLRFGFWGAEELSTDGSFGYLSGLSAADLNKIVFNVDFDDTATPNFTYDIGDPAYAIAHPSGFPLGGNFATSDWPQSAIDKSALGVNLFKSYMNSVGLPYTSRMSDRNITGSDNGNFIGFGIPTTSLVTGQGGGKTQEEANIFGGTAGNWDTCGDAPYVFCDNISNTDPNVHYTATKAYAAVTVGLAFDPNVRTGQ